MNELREQLNKLLAGGVLRLIASKSVNQSEPYKKIEVLPYGSGFQITCYTDKQAFHENVSSPEALAKRLEELVDGHFLRVNGWSVTHEYMILISKKGRCTLQKRRMNEDEVRSMSRYSASGLTMTDAEDDNPLGGPEPVRVSIKPGHNRAKHYIIEEGNQVAPLVDMGVFTKEGRVVRSMYDKFKQINRFLEILDDEISDLKTDEINVIDFGCGKSYLTFVVYYYLTQVRKMKARVIGLDLKADVIEKCNRAAKKYGYENLTFELGDINGYKAPFKVDMVITLHACDTATDYALYNAISWDAKMIFSVPCCQHELNGQMEPENLAILSRYGIIKERFSALATDAIRANLLEYSGYKTQLLEFVDFAHTPKNILIRAVRRNHTPEEVRKKAMEEVEALRKEFSYDPTLYRLLVED